MKFDYLKLANIIKTRRNDKGISTRKLAEKIGISHAEISRFENGLKPSFYLIPFVKMCEELELGIEDLLIEVGLLSEIEDKKYEVKVTNVNEDYFEIEARNKKEAALIVAKFVIENEIIEEYKKRFLETINDDLNMPAAMGIVWEVVRNEKKSKQLAELLLNFDKVLGLDLENSEEYLKEDQNIELPENISKLIEERKEARKNKNWELSDTIRDELKEKGYSVKDTKDGMTVERL